ncbi:MAG: C40 family peptidase [Castellaniella sp.]|uniref:C40 family peptidase n=1 Tax=Castellaniella sp. TaxID=1955812 RepID=UPI003C709FDF
MNPFFFLRWPVCAPRLPGLAVARRVLAWRLWLAAGAVAVLAGCAGPSARQDTARAAIQIDAAQRTEVVMTALSLLDTRYRYGSARPAQGFDCSGLVKYVFAAATHTALPHSTDQIAQLSRAVPREDLQPGDLVFFNTLGQPNSHMGIYLGDGRFINAPSTGGQVRVDSLDNPYYRKHFQSVGTLFKG